MEDNLISQSKQKASRQIPGSQTLCNDIADVLWCPLMLTCWGFVCVYAAGENNVSPGVFSLVGTWRRPMWKPLCSHVLISSVRNGLSLSAWLKAAMDGWAFHCVLALEVNTQEFVFSWLQQGCPLRSFDEVHEKKSDFIKCLYSWRILFSWCSCSYDWGHKLKCFSIQGWLEVLLHTGFRLGMTVANIFPQYAIFVSPQVLIWTP